MNGVGRQWQRSGAAGVHHQRQYSDNFLETSSNGICFSQLVFYTFHLPTHLILLLGYFFAFPIKSIRI
ncbi:hypothetical protein ACFX11_031898 [Malus domestica]